MRLVSLRFRPLTLDDAPRLHALYRESPTYFAQIGIEIPTLEDVVQEIHTLLKDPRRRAFLVETHREEVGYVDYKLHYPEEEEATLSLLLIRERLQGNGLGRTALAHLEGTLKGNVRRLYALVYGGNPRAQRFFQSQGYRFLKEGGPPLDWYVKEL